MKSEKIYVYFSTVIIFVGIVASTQPKLPKLFLIGDSISIQYGPYLQEYLNGMRTTLVIDSVHNQRSKAFKRYAADLDAFNRIADEVCAAKEIPVIDLYSLSVAMGEKEVIDHVHYQVPARMAQAGYIAGFLQNYLTKR